MSEESELFALIDLIHEALLDGNVWANVLTKFADLTGAAQISTILPPRKRRSPRRF